MFFFRPQSFGAVVSSWGSTRRGSHYLRDLRCARCGMPPPLPRPGARPVFSKRPEFIQSNFFVPEPAAASEETGHQPAHNIQVAFDPPPAHVAPVTVKQSDIQRVPSGFMPTNSRAPPSGEPQVAPSHSPILAPPAPNPAPPPPPPPAPITQAHMVSSVLFPPQPGHSCSLCPVVSSTVPPSASLLKPSIEMFNDADVRRQLEALPVCDASLDSTKQHTCQRAIFAALGKHCEAHCFRVCDVVRALNPESPAPAHQRCRVNLYILLNALKSSLRFPPVPTPPGPSARVYSFAPSLVPPPPPPPPPPPHNNAQEVISVEDSDDTDSDIELSGLAGLDPSEIPKPLIWSPECLFDRRPRFNRKNFECCREGEQELESTGSDDSIGLLEDAVSEDVGDSDDDVLSSSSHDSVCWECRDYGDLICCDACPRAFHAVCAKLDHIPVGEEPFVCGRCDDQHSENEEEGSDVDDIIDDTGLTTEESVHAQMRPMQAMFELSGRLKEEWTRSKPTLDGATDARVSLPPVKVNLLTTRPVGIPVAPSSPPEVTVEASTIRSALLRPVTLAGQLHEALVKLVNQPDADFDRITAEIDPALFTSQALGPTEDALITQFVEREEASRSLKRTKVVPESQCEPGDGASQQTAPATSP